MKYLALTILIIGGLFLTLGDIFLKKWSLGQSTGTYIAGMLFYIIGLNFFAMTLKEKNLAIASTILVTSNTVLLVIVSYFIFKEKFTLIQGMGIILSIISVILLEWGE